MFFYVQSEHYYFSFAKLNCLINAWTLYPGYNCKSNQVVMPLKTYTISFIQQQLNLFDFTAITGKTKSKFYELTLYSVWQFVQNNNHIVLFHCDRWLFTTYAVSKKKEIAWSICFSSAKPYPKYLNFVPRLRLWVMYQIVFPF